MDGHCVQSGISPVVLGMIMPGAALRACKKSLKVLV